MGVKALNVFNLKNRIKIFRYSIGSRLINSVPKGVRKTYDFIVWLERNSISFCKTGNYIEFEYLIQSVPYKFCISESSSDSDVFMQIIIEEEYDYVKTLIRENQIQIKTIVDAGANVGFTSLYFSHYFPGVNILALEPNPDVFIRLSNNVDLNHLNNIELFQKGIWNENTFLKSDQTFRDKQDWSFRLEEAQLEIDKKIEVISIDCLMEQKKIKTIDLLKIDIEGGEKDIFRKDANISWLENVKLIAIEIHDEFDCRWDIENILKSNGFELYYSGELTIGINTKCIQ